MDLRDGKVGDKVSSAASGGNRSPPPTNRSAVGTDGRAEELTLMCPHFRQKRPDVRPELDYAEIVLDLIDRNW